MKNTNEIQKPVSLVIGEFKDTIIGNINNSGLHISIIEMILKDIYLEVHAKTEHIAMQEASMYEKQCKETKDTVTE